MSEKNCSHNLFNHKLDIRVAEVKDVGVKQLILKVRITCSKCGRPFLFEGPAGFSTSVPSVSPDMQELRAPINWPLRDEDAPSGEGTSH